MFLVLDSEGEVNSGIGDFYGLQKSFLSLYDDLMVISSECLRVKHYLHSILFVGGQGKLIRAYLYIVPGILDQPDLAQLMVVALICKLKDYSVLSAQV